MIPRSARDTAGLSLQAAPGMMAMRDEFISHEKYSGGIPLLAAGWSRFHGTHVLDITLEYRRSSSIQNNSVSTTVTQFSLRQEPFYPLPRFRIFSRDAYAFLAPGRDLQLEAAIALLRDSS